MGKPERLIVLDIGKDLTIARATIWAALHVVCILLDKSKEICDRLGFLGKLAVCYLYSYHALVSYLYHFAALATQLAADDFQLIVAHSTLFPSLTCRTKCSSFRCAHIRPTIWSIPDRH